MGPPCAWEGSPRSSWNRAATPDLAFFLRKYSVFHITQNRYPRSSREARGDPGEVLGSPWDPLGGPWGCLAGSLRVLGVALGSLGGPWGDPGGPKGDLGEPRGGLLELLVKRKITETRLVFICFSQYGVPGVASKRAVGPLEGCGEVPWGPKGHQRDPRELQESPQGSSRGAVGGPRGPRRGIWAPQGHGRVIPEVLTF